MEELNEHEFDDSDHDNEDKNEDDDNQTSKNESITQKIIKFLCEFNPNRIKKKKIKDILPISSHQK